MWLATLPVPVLLAGLICATLFTMFLLFLVTCIPGAAERITRVLDAVYTLLYAKQKHDSKRYYQHRRRSRIQKKG